ncbi:MAG: methyltransferase domain-containing protein [Desulfarculaceae bacterium]|nr:methyltransferase domain-containing protein [Desulfarculaceae bacterium]MCF8074364.1 methyltransferase domain-containing protein [Desulfarculaceae bacterium]MCF8103536.1 methyltransferase domain-containing protein [Desulfarculaceae bacterium]MCF8117303.1 methyltransferase domain-containing protein [Desulfarculaceae bacterium]
MNLRYKLSFLHLFKIPGMLPIMKDYQAFLRTLFIFSAYDSGLLQALAQGPADLRSLAATLGATRPELLHALLEVGLACKELGQKGQEYVLKGKRSRAVANPKGDMVAAMIQANVSYYCDAYRHAAERMRGGELGRDLEEIGEVVARFSKGIEPIVRNFIKSIAAGKDSLRILDVGCGSAFFLQSAHSINPRATGVGLELDPAVAAQARRNIADWGLEERFAILQEDIRQPPPEADGPFDLINLSSILYYFANQERQELLSDLRARLAPGGLVSVMMNFASQGKDLAAANLNLVNCSLHGLYPLPGVGEIRELLGQCGFRDIEEHKFLPASTFQGVTARI